MNGPATADHALLNAAALLVTKRVLAAGDRIPFCATCRPFLHARVRARLPACRSRSLIPVGMCLCRLPQQRVATLLSGVGVVGLFRERILSSGRRRRCILRRWFVAGRLV